METFWFELGARLSDDADALEERVAERFNDMSVEERDEFDHQSTALRMRAIDLKLTAITDIFEAVEQNREELLAATGQVEQYVKVIEHFKELIELATHLVQLAGAVSSGSASPIVASLNAVQEDLGKLKEKGVSLNVTKRRFFWRGDLYKE